MEDFQKTIDNLVREQTEVRSSLVMERRAARAEADAERAAAEALRTEIVELKSQLKLQERTIEQLRAERDDAREQIAKVDVGVHRTLLAILERLMEVKQGMQARPTTAPRQIEERKTAASAPATRTTAKN